MLRHACGAGPQGRRGGRGWRWQRQGRAAQSTGAPLLQLLNLTAHGTVRVLVCEGQAPGRRSTRVWPSVKGEGQRSASLLSFPTRRLTPRPRLLTRPSPGLLAAPGTATAARGAKTVAKAAPWEGGSSSRAQRATPQLPLSAGQPQLGSRAEFTGSVTSVTYYTPVRCAPCLPCFRCCPCAPSMYCLPLSDPTHAFLHVHCLPLARSRSTASSRWTCRRQGSVSRGRP